ncbi:unnamed protein product [Pedinophyceae sp. YPF-701]|nr:unnamed protein product [Pedinophyceae sp. YPF-701]
MADPWLARDKVEHVLSCVLVTAVTALACRSYKPVRARLPAWALRCPPAWLGAAAGAAVGALKELGDGLQWWPGRASIRDGVADVVGVVLGVVLVRVLDARRGENARRTPEVVQPAAGVELV